MGRGYVQEYDHDIFVSYAHVDDEPFRRGEKGWVTTLIDGLRKRLAQKLGTRDGFDLWMDNRLAGYEPVTPQLLQKVRQSATLVVIWSPAYLASAWCRRERDTFLGVVDERRGRRVFLVEREPLDIAKRPPELADLSEFRFWVRDREGKAARILGFPQPSYDDLEYFNRLEDLVSDIVDELMRMRSEPSSVAPVASSLHDRATRPFPHLSDNPQVLVAPAGATVFLAQVTDDLDSQRNAVKRYLNQHGISVVPAIWYSQEPNAFRKAMARDFATADAFVQLLSGTGGKKPVDLPQGYPCYQWELAQELGGPVGKPVLQWRDPVLDIELVEDADHRRFLLAPTVRAEPIEDFKREVCRRLLEQPMPAPANMNMNVCVFVDMDAVDRPLADQVVEVLDNWGVGHSKPILDEVSCDPEEVRKDLELNLATCDALIIVYGSASAIWVRRQLNLCRKTLATRPMLPALAVFEGPPEEKVQLDMKLPKMAVLNCRQGLDEAKLKAFLAGIDAKAG